MYQIICVSSKQILFNDLTLKEANEKLDDVTKNYDMYKKDELKIERQRYEKENKEV